MTEHNTTACRSIGIAYQPGRLTSESRHFMTDGEPVFSTTIALGICVSFSDSAVLGPVQGGRPRRVPAAFPHAARVQDDLRFGA